MCNETFLGIICKVRVSAVIVKYVRLTITGDISNTKMFLKRKSETGWDTEAKVNGFIWKATEDNVLPV